MKFITSLALLCFILFQLSMCLLESKEHLLNYEGNTITDNTLRQLLENFRKVAGNPLAIPDQHVFINQTKIFLNVSITNGSITDPTSFKIDVAHVNMPELEFFVNLSYAALHLDGKYSLYLDNDYIHMESSDKWSVDISDMAVNIYTKLNLTKNETLQMENFILDYNMAMKVDIKYIGGNSEASDAINKLINYLIPDFIQSTKSDVQEITKGIVFERSKFILGGMTLQKFINFINSLI